MPRGRPKGAKNKTTAATAETSVKAAVKKTRGARAATEPAAQEPVKKPRAPRAPRAKATPKPAPEATVYEPVVRQTAAEALKRIDAKDIKTEKLAWGQWPPIDTPVYLVGFKARKFSFLEPFECGRDQGVLVVDYAKRHDRFPPEKYRIEARFVAYAPIS
ncbi:MAG: hypothetical protein ACXWQ5_00865 [Ktedonobacterales bacterium]